MFNTCWHLCFMDIILKLEPGKAFIKTEAWLQFCIHSWLPEHMALSVTFYTKLLSLSANFAIWKLALMYCHLPFLAELAFRAIHITLFSLVPFSEYQQMQFAVSAIQNFNCFSICFSSFSSVLFIGPVPLLCLHFQLPPTVLSMHISFPLRLYTNIRALTHTFVSRMCLTL